MQKVWLKQQFSICAIIVTIVKPSYICIDESWPFAFLNILTEANCIKSKPSLKRILIIPASLVRQTFLVILLAQVKLLTVELLKDV